MAEKILLFKFVENGIPKPLLPKNIKIVSEP